MNDMCDLIVSTFTVKEQEGTIVPSVVVLMCEDCDRQPRLWFSQRLFTEKCRRGEFVAPAAALMQSCVIVAVIVEQEWKMLQHQYNLPTNVNRERRKNWSLIINKKLFIWGHARNARREEQRPDATWLLTCVKWQPPLAILHANMCNFPSIYCQ